MKESGRDLRRGATAAGGHGHDGDRRAGERLLTDGPFMETKEHLLGFYLLDVPDLDTALDWAARMPIMRYGTVEVRPVVERHAEWQTALAIDAGPADARTGLPGRVERGRGDAGPPARRPAGRRGRGRRGIRRRRPAWPRDGVPPKPGAWLTLTAWRKAVDQLRDRQCAPSAHGLYPVLADLTAAAAGAAPDPGGAGRWTDDRLGLIFACCHPGAGPGGTGRADAALRRRA